MTLNLHSLLHDIFNSNHRSRCYSWPRDNVPKIRYLEIPINTSVFEVPAFAFKAFTRALHREAGTDVITAILFDDNGKCRYVSLDKVMDDVLRESFPDSRLVKLNITNLNKTYYGTAGAVFDENLNPVFVCSWRIGRDGQDGKYKILDPIIRISPDCYINQDDIVRRFLVKKLSVAALEREWQPPLVQEWYSPFTAPPLTGTDESYLARLEVCESPFVIRDVEVPSVSTTNEKLLQAALDHIDEVTA